MKARLQATVRVTAMIRMRSSGSGRWVAGSLIRTRTEALSHFYDVGGLVGALGICGEHRAIELVVSQMRVCLFPLVSVGSWTVEDETASSRAKRKTSQACGGLSGGEGLESRARANGKRSGGCSEA